MTTGQLLKELICTELAFCSTKYMDLAPIKKKLIKKNFTKIEFC